MDRVKRPGDHLNPAEVRHLANHLCEALARREWKRYTRDLTGGDAGKFRTFGGGKFRRVEPTTVEEGRGIVGVALPDLSLGIPNALAFYMSGAAWERYRAQVAPEVLEELDDHLAEGRKARPPFVRQTTARGRVYRRNTGGGVAKAVADALTGAVAHCEVVRTSDGETETLLGSAPTPNTAVLDYLQSVIGP